jgi:hypothetical protein
MIALADCIERAYILAYQENTYRLEKALREEGFTVLVRRPEYSQEEFKYSRVSKCLIGHKMIWEECRGKEGLFLIMEADFVPVRGMGRLPLPFDIRNKKSAFGHIYSSAQRIYELDNKKFARGHSSTMFAYVIGSEAAEVLIGFALNEFKKNDPTSYFPWDIYIRMYAQANGIFTYLPYRSYGEHGGFPNPEHKKAGINPIHRADVLYGRLHYLPLYARGSNTEYFLCRIKAKLRAAIRLLAGRYIELATIKNKNISIQEKIRMISFGITRLLTIY